MPLCLQKARKITLRETLIKQTGKTEILRTQYLQQVDNRAIDLLIHRWEPKEQYDTGF